MSQPKTVVNDGAEYEERDKHDCEGCAFPDWEYCAWPKCARSYRPDGRNVIFVRVEK